MAADRPLAGGGLGEQIVVAARTMLARGLVTGTSGNVSARLPSGMLITPTRVHADDLAPDALVELSLDGAGGANPSVEWRMHAGIYRARPDVGAIVHTHSPYAVARSYDPTPLVVRTQERTYLGLERIAVAPDAPAGTEALASCAVAALGDGAAALLAYHGVVAVAATPRDALELASTVEHQALIASIVARH